MAKYEITYSCGHCGVIDLIGKGTDRERKIKYYEDYGLCKECYKLKKEKEAKEQGLILNAAVLPYIDNEDGKILVLIWYSGDTMPYKDKIKELGYRWQNNRITDKMCWCMIVKEDGDFDKIIEDAIKLGAKTFKDNNDFISYVYSNLAITKKKEWKIKQEKIAKLKKPIAPDVLKGHKWNQKIYGKEGNYSIYPDGNKVIITDEQAREIEDYLLAKEKYNEKVDVINKGSYIVD